MYTEWLKQLIDELAKPLPGLEAQQRLSPPGVDHSPAGKSEKESAVLIVLYNDAGKTRTLFIKRAEYDGVHSGQVSLPGGMFKQSDINLRNTALRETFEETGIPESSVEIIGSLTALYIPVSGITVHPFVGFCRNKPTLTPDPTEVKYIIEAGIEELLNPDNQKYKVMQIGEKEVDIPYFDIYGEHIWGATAMIMSEFLEIIKRMV